MLHYAAPTKIYMLKNKNSKKIKPLFDLAFSKRPKHELYNLSNDPFQMNNLAEDNEYSSVLESLSNQLNAYLVKTKDPREVGQLFDWDNTPYYKDMDKKPKPSKNAIQILGLKKEYNYLD
jgi:hypothetical protein